MVEEHVQQKKLGNIKNGRAGEGVGKKWKKGAVSNIEGLHKIGGKEPSVNYVKTTRFMVPQEFIYIYIFMFIQIV